MLAAAIDRGIIDSLEQHEIAEAALRRGEGTPAALRLSWARRYGIRLPRVAVCPGHVAPLDAIWRVYTGLDRKALWLANRGGGKTNGLGFMRASECEHKGVDACHVAATLDQGSRMQRYASQYVAGREEILAPGHADVKQKIRFRGGQQLEILPATTKGVNGPHAPKLSLDELDLMDWEVVQQAFSIPMSRGDEPVSVCIASTRKYAGGPMQKIIDTAAARGFAVHTWCIFETMRRCEEPDCERCKKLLSYDRMGRPHSFAEVCGGKARLSDGYIALQDVHEAFTGLDWETFDAEWLCNRPELASAYYPHFQRAIHVLGPHNTIWRPSAQLADSPTTPAGHRMFWDFGSTARNAIVFLQPAGPPSAPWRTVVCVDLVESLAGETTIEIAPEVVKCGRSYGPPRGPHWGDPAGKAKQNVKGGSSAIRQLAEIGIIVRAAKKGNSFATRRDLLVEWLRCRASRGGEPAMYFWAGDPADPRDCPGGKMLIHHLESVRRAVDDSGESRGDQPVQDEHYHSVSALEFGAVGMTLYEGIKPC